MNVTALLIQLMNKQTMPSAILLEGSNTLIEQELDEVFSAWFCQTHDHCGHCDGCKLYVHQNLPDFHKIEPHQAGHAIKIEQIRDLHEISRQTPQILNFQVVWIKHADTLNEFAANALLKVLEEPIKNFFFILSAENVKLLPLTIRSRCWLLQATDNQAFLSESKASIYAQKETLISALYGFVLQQIDLAMLLKGFENYPTDDVLWLLQIMVSEVIDGLMGGVVDTLSDLQFAGSIAIPFGYWWQFWDALIDAKRKYRTQSSLQSSILLSRLLLILHGHAYE